MRSIAVFGLALAFVSRAHSAEPAAGAVDAAQVVRDEVAKAVSIPEQAFVLIRLAWPEPPGDPAVRALARAEIVGFSSHAIVPLRAAIRTVRPEYQEDVVLALMEAFHTVPAGIPVDYPVAIEEAIWYGTEAAKRVTIPEAGRLKYQAALVTILDAAREYPALTPLCIDALGAMGDDRARFFLERQLQEGKGQTPQLAADALARIGKRALLPLKAALRADRRPVREAAARAFLPIATLDDLSALHEYVADHPKDDPATVRAVKEVAATLERLREAKEAATAASPGSSR